VRTNRFRKARIIFSQLQSTLKLPLVLKRIQIFQDLIKKRSQKCEELKKCEEANVDSGYIMMGRCTEVTYYITLSKKKMNTNTQ
jgi:hypothetical protein